MFTHSAAYYDLIYDWKDYASETDKIRSLLEGSGSLLDVACGTGQHHRYLKQDFAVTGLDIQPEFIDIARAKNPECVYHVGDMQNFDLGQQFDAVTCLFSSIGYLDSLDALTQTLQCLARHLKPGGGLIVEPWLTPEAWVSGRNLSTTVSQTMHTEVCRMTVGQIEKEGSELPVSVQQFGYMIGSVDGIEHFSETHRMSLFSQEQMLAAFSQAGFDCVYSDEGLTNRGLYLGRLKV